jgi:hypothetical protein
MESVILFGKGRYFEEKKDSLFARYSVKEIWDNSIKKGNRETYGDVPVINPSDADISGDELVFIMGVRFIGMWKFLVELGVDPTRLILPYNIPNSFENDFALCNCVQDISFGKEKISITSKSGREYQVFDEDEWRDVLRSFYREAYPIVGAIASMGTEPVSLQFATERGTPVDRYYIEKFLDSNRKYIKGDVLEIEDNTYTLQFGSDGCKSLVMDVSSNADIVDFLANLETGEGIRDQVADCFICTQTLMYLYDMKSVSENIHRLLKTGGVALITCSGLSQNSRRCMDNYGCTYNFNVDALKRMFADKEKFEVLDAGSYGNVKTVCAHLAGLCGEDLADEDFEVDDKYYPLIVYAVIKRVD